MNKLLYCFFLSFSVMATSACTDDKEERELPPAPDFQPDDPERESAQ